MTRPVEVHYPKRKHREQLLEKHYYNTLGRCDTHWHRKHRQGCSCREWENKMFDRLLTNTDITNYVVNGEESVTPLYAKWCELKLEIY